MAQDIFIGVDGGATKVQVRIEDSAGRLIGQGRGGPSNIRLSVSVTWASIFQAIEEALYSSGISIYDKTRYSFHAGMGLAGCETKDAYQEFLKHPHPFKTLKVVSDAHTSCLGAHGGRDGAIIIAGTGVVGYQLENGKSTKVGGWGFPHDDIGSGAWLGLEVTRLTFQWIDHRIEKSPLLEEVFDFFNQDLDYFLGWANHANSTEYARLAPLIINFAQHNDHIAIQLLKTAAIGIDSIHATLLKLQRNQSTPLPCSLFGGISPFLLPYLSESLRKRIVPQKADENKGALLMIRDEVRCKDYV